ncbi:Hypothetical_protein [Hexamita inflata]|uniref:Hypothetical_protein n=1 Tax=Hexamita inflata TaxID=28002 RepID=A0AA86UJD3_9EUKA|nr:Hypothetical protein HINF_LOCUS48150 [Hexamita inflata]
MTMRILTKLVEQPSVLLIICLKIQILIFSGSGQFVREAADAEAARVQEDTQQIYTNWDSLHLQLQHNNGKRTHHICSTEQHFHPAFKGETSGREQRKGPRPKRRRPTRGARSALGRSWGISILLFIFPFIVLDFTLLCQCEIASRRRVVRYLGQCSPSSSITFLLLSATSQRRFRKAQVGKPEKSDSDTARAQTLPRSCDQTSLQVPTEHLVDEKCVSKRSARTRATY